MPGSVLSKRVRIADPTQSIAASGVTIADRPSADPRQRWLETFRSVRAETERRAALLSPEDQVVQSMPDASPTKWHRAHVTWFFEQFLLKPYVKNYTPFDERFAYLYNSYYVSAGPRAARPQRGLVTRPSAAEIAAYRAHVDAAVSDLIETASDFDQIVPIIEIGLNHEQQHQELLLTDILHAFSLNETSPAYDPDWQWPSMDQRAVAAVTLSGLDTIGHDGDSFCFDNEEPVHQIVLRPVWLSPRLVSNGEWFDFMADGGYTTPTLWLSDGFATVEAQGWNAPGLLAQGRRRVVLDDPWRAAARRSGAAGLPRQLLRSRRLCPLVGKASSDRSGVGSGGRDATPSPTPSALLWQWTRSAYSPYPGYRAAPGALGEYNGKFMVNQMVLRGSSLATPAGHSRLTYRNFFYPQARWQFSGLRLAEYEH